jgi:hypothetical protein
MEYKNTELKLDTVITYFNERRINLAPAFQRNRAWGPKMRQELIKNIVRHRPIPAIFIYKKEADSKYVFTILDGKQRLETILMFIRDDNPQLSIHTWKEYITEQKYRDESGFDVSVEWQNKKLPFAEFPNDEIRALREYVIPTIEISLEEDTNLDEIIDLFVDINSKGVKVKRTDIVKAIKRDDELLKSVYDLLITKRVKNMDRVVKILHSNIRTVLNKLTVVMRAPDGPARADRMWEKLMDLVMFIRGGNSHSKGSLGKFMDGKKTELPLSVDERNKLQRVFSFLRKAYARGLKNTRLASEYAHFYIMCTSLLRQEIFPVVILETDRDLLMQRLTEFGNKMDVEPKPFVESSKMGEYLLLSGRQTTDVKKREKREELFSKILETL